MCYNMTSIPRDVSRGQDHGPCVKCRAVGSTGRTPMENVHVSSHPLVKHKLAILRDKTTEPVKFRQLIRELAVLLCYEATQDLEVREIPVETPMGTAIGNRLVEEIGLVPI